MLDFKARYKAYKNAEYMSTSLSKIFSLVVAFFIFGLFYYAIMTFIESFGLRVFMFLIAFIAVCIIWAVVDNKLKKCFLIMLFKYELRKNIKTNYEKQNSMMR